MGVYQIHTMRHLQILCGLVLFSCTQALVFPNLRSQECQTASVCNETICEELGEANCHCSGNETKFGLEDRPQIVYLTFDDAFTAVAEEDFYRVLFNGTYKNPNNCSIRATHFITQSYTDYELVNRYWHKGHEIAAHSITHRNDISYWQKLDVEGWKDEMVGVRKMIAQFATIDPCEITGNRAPFLQGGGDAMFQMLQENNFDYDCTWPTRKFGYIDAEAGLYPYTLDFASTQDCPIEPCPKCSYPGLWVQPMIDLEDDWIGSNPQLPNNGNVCSMLDGCVIMNQPETAETVYDMLMKNFKRVYEGETDEYGDFQPGNKAPWGLYMHAAWFFGESPGCGSRRQGPRPRHGWLQDPFRLLWQDCQGRQQPRRCERSRQRVRWQLQAGACPLANGSRQVPHGQARGLHALQGCAPGRQDRRQEG